MRLNTEDTENCNSSRKNNNKSFVQDPYRYKQKADELLKTKRILTPGANSLTNGRIVFPTQKSIKMNRIKSVKEIEKSISHTSICNYYDNSQLIGQILEN